MYKTVKSIEEIALTSTEQSSDELCDIEQAHSEECQSSYSDLQYSQLQYSITLTVLSIVPDRTVRHRRCQSLRD